MVYLCVLLGNNMNDHVSSYEHHFHHHHTSPRKKKHIPQPPTQGQACGSMDTKIYYNFVRTVQNKCTVIVLTLISQIPSLQHVHSTRLSGDAPMNG